MQDNIYLIYNYISPIDTPSPFLFHLSPQGSEVTVRAGRDRTHFMVKYVFLILLFMLFIYSSFTCLVVMSPPVTLK